MVSAKSPLSASAVNDGRQIGEVSVQVDVLGVVPANVPRAISVSLKIKKVSFQENCRTASYNLPTSHMLDHFLLIWDSSSESTMVLVWKPVDCSLWVGCHCLKLSSLSILVLVLERRQNETSDRPIDCGLCRYVGKN